MEILDITFSENYTKIFFYIYKKINHLKIFKNHTLDFYSENRSKDTFVHSKKELINNYFFLDRKMYTSFLFSIEEKEVLKKLIFKFISSNFLKNSFLEKKQEIFINLEDFFKEDSTINWQNVFSGSIKNNAYFDSLNISIHKGGNNFYHLCFDISITENIQKKIEELRKKEDKIIFKLRYQLFLNKKLKFFGGFGGSTAIYKFYKENIFFLHDEVEMLLKDFFLNSLSQVFGRGSALQIKQENIKNEDIIKNLDALGFDIFHYTNTSDIRLHYSYKKYYEISILKEFIDFKNNVELDNNLSDFIYFFSPLSYRLHFLNLIQSLKKEISLLACLLNKNNKKDLTLLLKISQDFYNKYSIFQKLKFEYESCNWKYQFREISEFLASINKYSISRKDEKIDFYKDTLEGLGNDIKETQELFLVYDSMLKNYREIQSIRSSNFLGKIAIWVSIISLIIALFFGVIENFH